MGRAAKARRDAYIADADWCVSCDDELAAMTRTSEKRYAVSARLKPGYGTASSFDRAMDDHRGLEAALRDLAGKVLVSGAMPDAATAPIHAVHDFLLASDAFEKIEWGRVRPPDVHPSPSPAATKALVRPPLDPVTERCLRLCENSWDQTALARRLLVNKETLPRGQYTTVTLTDGDAERYGLEPKLRLWFSRMAFGVDARSVSGEELSSAVAYADAPDAAGRRANVRASAVVGLAAAFREALLD